MLCKDGSLLDSKSMKMVADFAEEKGFQVWLERVGEQDQCAVIIEDGHVKESEAAE